MNNTFSELIQTLKRIERQQRRMSRIAPNYTVKSAGEFTIAGGVITLTGYDQIRFITIDTQGDAASDDLDTISGGVAGDILIACANNATRTVVIKDDTDNLRLAGDCTLDNNTDTITLFCVGTTWREIARSDNGA